MPVSLAKLSYAVRWSWLQYRFPKIEIKKDWNKKANRNFKARKVGPQDWSNHEPCKWWLLCIKRIVRVVIASTNQVGFLVSLRWFFSAFLGSHSCFRLQDWIWFWPPLKFFGFFFFALHYSSTSLLALFPPISFCESGYFFLLCSWSALEQMWMSPPWLAAGVAISRLQLVLK